ncbi:hypothetical protein ACQKNC_07845 [Lysinibacillus sp. NPDC094177]|uniref:hypothetical protein n=1 Tax=Lysinibacillus sp. NPDC094177 TaxID=3390580 RepID=UPI003D028F57
MDGNMKSIKKYGFGIFTIVLIAIGLLILINGVESADEYLSNTMGGSMDTESFLIIKSIISLDILAI